MLLLAGFAIGLTVGLLVGAALLDMTVGKTLRRRVHRANSRVMRLRVEQSLRHPW